MRLAMFHSWHAGADCINPLSYIAIRARDGRWFAAYVPSREELRTGSTPRISMEKVRASAQQAASTTWFAPTGFFMTYQAWRKNVSGIVKGPLPFFWGVGKTA